jgi:TetR/AcrR family transcriptional repressor of mexJK operon
MELREDSRAGRKHLAITDAAMSLFLQKGYDGASMDDIATSAGVSKQTVYMHFGDKERLFRYIILATTKRIEGLIALIATSLAETQDIGHDLDQLARRFIREIMEPQLLRLRRLVIATADRFPEVGRIWFEQGFERALASLASAFARLEERGLMHVEDPLLAANHFVGMLLWIPVNRAMYTGNYHFYTSAELDRYADDAVRAFLRAYGPLRTK